MKKSSKKVKSDRINALRKQYDAFVEEDKKRKERNDLILNKLDKMRYCYTTTLSCRSTPALQISPQSGLYNRGKTLEKSSIYGSYLPSPTKQLPMDVSEKHLDDSMLLQELTKKYILIPKRSSMFSNDFSEPIRPAIESDTDWKSKYDILNELKQKDKAECEKEKENPVKDEEPYVKVNYNEQMLSNNIMKISDNEQRHDVECVIITPDKDLNLSNTVYLNKISDDDDKSTANITCKDTQLNINNTQNVSTTAINDLESKFSALTVEQGITESLECINPEITQQLIDSNLSTPALGNLECLKNHAESDLPQQKESVENHDPNYTQPIISAIGSTDLINNTTGDSNIVTTENLKESEAIQYPIEIINVQEFTPDENVILEDGVNINPHLDKEDASLVQEQNEVVTEEAVIDSVDVSGIEAFDTEQREMFYSEEPSENYSYDQTNPENAYQEYPQNESYPQNEEYAYYEGVPQDQNYPAEVNEFEETSQPYDQTYQEQYAVYDPVSYVQEETYVQEPQQYEEIQEIDPSVQPGIEQLQYEQQNYESQQVEKQLDYEQGYTENEELENTQLADNTVNQEIKIAQAPENLEINENIIQENTLNN